MLLGCGFEQSRTCEGARAKLDFIQLRRLLIPACLRIALTENRENLRQRNVVSRIRRQDNGDPQLARNAVAARAAQRLAITMQLHLAARNFALCPIHQPQDRQYDDSAGTHEYGSVGDLGSDRDLRRAEWKVVNHRRPDVTDNHNYPINIFIIARGSLHVQDSDS